MLSLCAGYDSALIRLPHAAYGRRTARLTLTGWFCPRLHETRPTAAATPPPALRACSWIVPAPVLDDAWEQDS